MRMVHIFLFVREVYDMSLPQEVTQEIFQVIQGGSTLGTPAEIIQFPSDNGQNVYNVVQKTFQGNNGTGFNYWVVAAETLIGEVTMAVSAGAAILTMPLAGPTGAVVGIAAALGLTTGYVLYEIAPEFWNDVSEDLVNAGETIGGKLITMIDNRGVMTFSPDAIEIIKNKLLDYGAFDTSEEGTPSPWQESVINDHDLETINFPIPSAKSVHARSESYTNIYNITYTITNGHLYNYYNVDVVAVSSTGEQVLRHTENYVKETGQTLIYDDLFTLTEITNPGYLQPAGEQHYYEYNFLLPGSINSVSIDSAASAINANYRSIDEILLYGVVTQGNPNIQPNAVLPDSNPFPLTYPDWTPVEFPEIIPPAGTPVYIPDRFPVEYPDNLPDSEDYQDEAQEPDPDAEDYPDYVVRTIEDPDNDPTRGTEEEEEIEPDPDPQPEPDPIEDEPAPPTGDDPIDPNNDPTPSVPIVVPPLPDTVDSNKLFTVYNPSSSQLDALGGYLWDASIIAAIRDIWQEPMDGLISLQQVFVTPTTSGSHNIILGFLDSGVSSPVVSDQFVTVDCGTVTVEENKKNATDYAPYTSLHLYLPFIGIVELDTNECMNASITVTYQVDVYTGTCLAQVSVTRTEDMPDDPILYTFSGNCSQQLPLTSGNSTGVLSALLAGVGVGVSIASGGGLSTVAGYHLAGSSLTHEMMHVSHSGNISANAGIMGQKKPYLIIGRRHGYDANDYNSFYGFPANKTIILANHTGYCKVKKCWVKTSATKAEYEEIMRILEEDGVFV